MTDTRPRITRSKPINPNQLSSEMGVALTWDSNEIVVAEEGLSTQAQLEAAVTAHVANAEFGLPQEQTRLTAALAKANSILADPAGSTDWTTLERKVILAALVKRILSGLA